MLVPEGNGGGKEEIEMVSERGTRDGELGTFAQLDTPMSESIQRIENMKTITKAGAVFGAGLVLGICGVTTAGANGVLAELRSSAALLPALPAGMALPSPPAGGLVIGAQPWLADASQGFTPVLDVETGVGLPGQRPLHRLD